MTFYADEKKKMNFIKKILVFLLFLFSYTQLLVAQNNDSNTVNFPVICFNQTALFQGTSDTQKYAGLFSDYGTHKNGIGIEGELVNYTDIQMLQKIRKNKDMPESIGFSAKLAGIYYQNDFGIPGEKFTGELYLGASYSLGESNNLFEKYPLITGKRTHTMRIGYKGYLTTDSTSQITGLLDYVFVKNRNAFLVNYENDTMFFYLTDKYRTAAFKMSYLYDLGKDIIGLSLGFSLWAGERKNLWGWKNGALYVSDEVSRENTVTLYNGKNYSVDVVYVSFLFNNYSLSVGYDSELFKKLIHNNIHYVLNDGSLPIIDRADRIYILFQIGLPDDLF